jgi:hypothetical protein
LLIQTKNSASKLCIAIYRYRQLKITIIVNVIMCSVFAKDLLKVFHKPGVVGGGCVPVTETNANNKFSSRRVNDGQNALLVYRSHACPIGPSNISERT